MMTSEPILAVGILDGAPEVRGVLHGSFLSDSGASLTGQFTARATRESVTLSLAGGDLLDGGRELRLLAVGEARAEILNVTIGIQIHWERTEARNLAIGFWRGLRNPPPERSRSYPQVSPHMWITGMSILP